MGAEREERRVEFSSFASFRSILRSSISRSFASTLRIAAFSSRCSCRAPSSFWFCRAASSSPSRVAILPSSSATRVWSFAAAESRSISSALDWSSAAFSSISRDLTSTSVLFSATLASSPSAFSVAVASWALSRSTSGLGLSPRRAWISYPISSFWDLRSSISRAERFSSAIFSFTALSHWRRRFVTCSCALHSSVDLASSVRRRFASSSSSAPVDGRRDCGGVGRSGVEVDAVEAASADAFVC